VIHLAQSHCDNWGLAVDKNQTVNLQLKKGHYDPIHCFRGANKIPRVHVIEALLLTGHMINGASTFGRENSFTFNKQQQSAR